MDGVIFCYCSWNQINMRIRNYILHSKYSCCCCCCCSWQRKRCWCRNGGGGRPNRQTYNILIQYFASTSPPAITKSFLEKICAEGAYNKPDMDLLTATVASFERNQQPFKALNLIKTVTILYQKHLSRRLSPSQTVLPAEHCHSSHSDATTRLCVQPRDGSQWELSCLSTTKTNGISRFWCFHRLSILDSKPSTSRFLTSLLICLKLNCYYITCNTSHASSLLQLYSPHFDQSWMRQPFLVSYMMKRRSYG
jgi:hypothetical protein